MFAYLNKILFKTKTPDSSNVQEDPEFQPYMVQRWCSMHSSEAATFVNNTSNRVWSSLNDKEHWFKYLYGILPQYKFSRVNYIKKKKEDNKNSKDKETVLKIATSLEISSRELNQYMEQFNLKLPKGDKNNE